MSAAVKEISVEEKERRWKSGRHGDGGGDREVSNSESDAGIYGPWYYGTETGDAQVGK